MLSKCPKCEHVNSFEIVTVEPTGSAFKVNFVQCRLCGAVVGAMEFFNSGAILHQIQDAIKKNHDESTSRLSQIEHVLRVMANR